MKVCVVGATGRTGRCVVRELADRNIPAVAVVRNPDLAREVLPAGVEIRQADVLETETLASAVEGCDRLICATGARPSLNPIGPLQVDYIGIQNLAIAAQKARIQHFVLVSSLCVSRFFHPLNLFWLILLWKKQAECHLQQSGLTYTIVRPGGLLDREKTGNLVMEPADSLFEGSLPRARVARVCVEALTCDAAQNKIVEIVVREEAPETPLSELFDRV